MSNDPSHGSSDQDAAASDEELWEHAVRGVKPLAGRRCREVPSPPGAHAEASSPPGPADSRQSPLSSPGRRLLRQLRRGRVPIQESLDLHGLTQAEARRELGLFVRESAELGLTCVRVVHGKGRHSPGRESVLRQKVSEWLNEPGNREYILAVAPTSPRHGGSGAMYVLLKTTANRSGSSRVRGKARRRGSS